MVKVSNATVRKRGAILLRDVSFDVASTGVTAVVGPNGSGKSTLLRMLHGLERVRNGSVEIGVDPMEQSFLFQSPVLLRRSVGENLILPLKLRKVEKGLREDKVRSLAQQFDLDGLLEKDAHLLSGGEKQKLALARALITNPKVLFMDEPSANLDRPSTQMIEAAIRDVVGQGTKVFLASHSMAQVKRIATDLIFVEGPGVHGPFSVADFFATPTPDAARSWLEDV